jgi:type VI secretion system FHA domain protein
MSEMQSYPQSHPQSHSHPPALLLQVQTYRQQALSAVSSVLFGATGGTYGRAPENDLVLDDPSKYISRVHARLSWREGSFYLRDEGVNPSIVDGRALGPGTETALVDGASIVVGDYTLLVLLEATPAEFSPAPDATLLQTARELPAAAELPLFEPPPTAPPALPLFEPPGAPARTAPLEPDPANALNSARILGNHDGETTDLDPLGLNLFAGLVQPPSTVSGKRDVAPPYRGAESDHAAPDSHMFALPVSSVQAIPADYDPLADVLVAEVRGNESVPKGSEAALTPPTMSPPASNGSLGPAASAPGSAGDAVLAALLEGLGLPHLHPSGTPEALAREVGAMLRAAVGGTIDVLMARALTKRESRIEMTMLAARENNPLKFFPDAGSALTQMLGPPQPGYLAPLPALNGAFDDLKAHELAVIVGMRAALGAVAKRFDPAYVEARVAESPRFHRLFPFARKARLWDCLVANHADMARDADEDLQRLFGEKFAHAYDDQVARLSRERD